MRIVGLTFSAAILVSGGSLTHMALAATLQQQIDALNAQNSQTRSVVQGLQAQAASYQDAINQLQQQISGLQASINANVAQQAQLQQQITEAQNEINHEKTILADDVKTMYVDGTPSTLEVLATSKNLSDFVDKQEYRTAVQNKLQDTLNKIAALQAELQDKKAAVDQLLGEEKDQQAQLASAQAQQAAMLNYNQAQQASYNAQIQANSSKISQLRAQQAAENAKLGNGLIYSGSCGGGYPADAKGPYGNWGCNHPMDNTIDNWGLYNRECVSYAAFKVYQAYGSMPYWGGRGNANEWPGNARAAGIPVDSHPTPGSVAIWDVGAYGHAMWVEAVNANGSILVSQYNYSYDGRYSEMTVSASQAATFHYIHFK